MIQQGFTITFLAVWTFVGVVAGTMLFGFAGCNLPFSVSVNGQHYVIQRDRLEQNK